MASYGFVVGDKYTKADIYRICKVPIEKQRGNWDTGYTNYDGDWFIFCNIGIPGRTGHDYKNRFEGEGLIWYGKTSTHIGQGAIQALLRPEGDVLIFYRENDRDPFTFAGSAFARSYKATVPVQITWGFKPTSEGFDGLPEEILDPSLVTEGAAKSIVVNVYERNREARRICIAKHGAICAVCGFDFESTYGEVGAGYIHVHHLKELAEIGTEYQLNPYEDLRPVCPNCHAMLHRRRPAYTIAELKTLLWTVRNPHADQVKVDDE